MADNCSLKIGDVPITALISLSKFFIIDSKSLYNKTDKWQRHKMSCYVDNIYIIHKITIEPGRRSFRELNQKTF